MICVACNRLARERGYMVCYRCRCHLAENRSVTLHRELFPCAAQVEDEYRGSEQYHENIRKYTERASKGLPLFDE